MLLTKKALQIDPPIVVVHFPPGKIDMEGRLQSWFDQAEGFRFGHTRTIILQCVIQQAEVQVSQENTPIT